MAKLTYNNIRNTSISHILFNLNNGYYPRVSKNEDVNPRFLLKSVHELLSKISEPMTVYHKNLYYK